MRPGGGLGNELLCIGAIVMSAQANRAKYTLEFAVNLKCPFRKTKLFSKQFFFFPTIFNPVWQIYVHLSNFCLPETSLQDKQGKLTPLQHNHFCTIRINPDLTPADRLYEVLYSS